MIIRASLFKYNIFRTLVRYETGTLQDTLILHLGVAMLLALRRPSLHQLHGVQFGPVHLRTGKSPACTFDADRVLDDFNPWTGVDQPPHQPEVAPRHGFLRPQPKYEALHGLFGHLMKLDQLLQLVAQGHQVSSLSILTPEHLLRRAPFLGPIVGSGI